MLNHAVSPSPGRSDSLRALATAAVVLVAIGTVEAAWPAHINIPGADFIFLSDISSNWRFVVGSYCMPGRCSNFLWDRGEFTTISIPGAQETYLSGVNNAGEVVGFAWSPDTGELAFMRRANGTVIPVTCPFATSVRPSVINEGGTVVGSSYAAGEETSDGFRWRNGHCERLPITDGHVVPTDVSANGLIVGIAGATGELEPFYGFIVQRDEVIAIEHPDAPFAQGGVTALSAVAPNGLVLGWWSADVGGVIHGVIEWFVYRDGLFEPVAMPGDPRDLRQLSISSSGLITYATGDGVIRTMRVESTLAR